MTPDGEPSRAPLGGDPPAAAPPSEGLEQGGGGETAPGTSRGLQIPGLAVPGVADLRSDSASWVELFYDLVLAAATIVFSHSYSGAIGWADAGWLMGVFAVLWWAWFYTTELTNRDRVDRFSRRILLLVQMFVITIYAVVGGNAIKSHDAAVIDVAGGLLLAVALLAHFIARSVPELRVMATARRNALFAAGVLCLTGDALPRIPQYVAWFIAACLVVLPAVLPRYDEATTRTRSDDNHLAERFGLLTLIVLGESFVKVALTASSSGLSQINFLVLALEFLIVFGIWASYFDDISPFGPPQGPVARRVWMLSHMPLQLAIVAMAEGLVRWETLQITGALSFLDIRLFTAPLSGAYVMMAVIGMVTPRRGRGLVVGLRLTVAALVWVVAILAWKVSFVSVEVAAGLNAACVLGGVAVTEWLHFSHRVERVPSPRGR